MCWFFLVVQQGAEATWKKLNEKGENFYIRTVVAIWTFFKN
jgi:hypothetical protein